VNPGTTYANACDVMGKCNEKTATLGPGATHPSLTALSIGLSSHRLTLLGTVFGTEIGCALYSAFQELFYAVKNV